MCMLIGNKKDKVRRQVSYKVASEYARQNNFGFLEVSAKTGAGVQEAFNRLILECYKETNQQEIETSEQEQPLCYSSDEIPINPREEVLRDSLKLEDLKLTRKSKVTEYNYEDFEFQS